jgi:hypothetical protein
MAKQLLSLKWAGESDTPRRATGHQTSEAGCESGKLRTRRGNAVERVARGNASEGTLRCREIRPADAGSSAHWRAERQAQKGTVPGHATRLCVVSTRREPGVKYHPTATENRHTERSNLPVALGQALSRQPAASSRRAGCPKKPRPRVTAGIS